MSWETAWQEGRTGWDVGSSPPELQRRVAAHTQRYRRVLAPGCGSGRDLLTLGAIADEVVGIDLAPTACKRFNEMASTVEASRIRYITADFFAWQPEEPFDLIWDYTFLCALEPAMRRRWAEKLAALCTPGGELWTLIFPVVATGPNPGGPPYPMSPGLVGELLEGIFQQLELHQVEQSHPGREGKEWFARWRRC